MREQVSSSVRDDDRSGLSLPVSVNDGALLLSDVLPVPFPSLRVDGLSDGTDGSQGREIVSLDVLLT